jgi:hypothetical protein
MLAQVYTMPRGGPGFAEPVHRRAGDGRQLLPTAEARLLRVRTGRGEMVPLGFTYPTCDAVGDTLVLQNVFGT